MKLEVVALVFSIAGVIVTSVVIVIQTQILRRQTKISDEQKQIQRNQNELESKKVALDVFEHATTQWKEMNGSGTVNRLFDEFPRLDPAVPWDESWMQLPPRDQEICAFAQRAISLERLTEAYPGDDWTRVQDNALTLVGHLNDFATYLDWDLLEIRPVMAKYHVGILQRAWLLEPLIVCRNTRAESAHRSPRWGYPVLRLAELARIHHDLSGIQAGGVKISAIKEKGLWTGHGCRTPLEVYSSETSCFGTPIPGGQWRTASSAYYPRRFLTDDKREAQLDWMDAVRARMESIREQGLGDD